jgi:hypothetical protein
MNRIARAVILSAAALATIASTIGFADAGDRYWRRHRIVKPWKKHVVVTGIAAGIVAGAVVAARPRVVYREEPVAVDQAPIYDEDGIYAAPDEDVGLYRDDAPDADEYAAPAYDDDGDDGAYDENRVVGTEDNFFPDRPEALAGEKRESTAPKKVIREEADAANLKPWTKEWKEWCSDRFSSFNPQNGTYLGYDQKRHFCKAG